MTTYPAWTPASRPGIIPLHPLSFGTILGRSFAALRQNPRVLLGFALVVQTLAYLVVLGGVLVVSWASFSRLDTLSMGTEEYDTVMAGSIALTAVTGIVLSLAAGALSVIVQGIVVIEVTHAAVAEKLSLGALWRQLKPVAWRLIGYSLLVILAVIALVTAVVLGVVGIAVVAPPAAIALTILLVLAAIPLTWWLMIKLLLVPAAIIVERATIGRALARSWTLTRGRFWPALGIILVITVIFGAIAQVVSIPFTFLSMGLTTIITPTGDPEPSAIIGALTTALLTQVLTLLLQSVAVVVQATATALIYIDCRMRREGLDLDLLAYVERRDSGATALPDPYAEHIGREIAPRGWVGAYGPPAGSASGYPRAYGPSAGYAPPPGYGDPGGYTPPPGYGAQPPAALAYPGHAAAPGYSVQHGYLPPAASPDSATSPADPADAPPAAAPDPAGSTPPDATWWAAPGAAPENDGTGHDGAEHDGSGRGAPWP